MSYSIPLHPDLVRELRDKGRLDEMVRIRNEARKRGVDEPNPKPPRWDFSKGVVNQPKIVILADFSDKPADTATYPTSYYEELLFSVDTYPTGSMRDWYLENSYGQLDVSGTVTIWLRMPQTYAYYVDGQHGFGAYPRNVQRLVKDAVLAADPYIDFSQFDTDGDGFIDALAVVHAGYGAEETGSRHDIWSHAWFVLPPVLVDGVRAFRYAMNPKNGKIGVFGHELAHLFGLPDLYDYGNDSHGLGMWSMMSAGVWGGGGTRPVHFDAWSKKTIGFLTPVVVTDYITSAEIPQIATDPVVYRLWTEGLAGEEYFLVSNRQRVGFDQFIPGEGLLIYHVDEGQPNNNDQTHYLVALEQADGRFDLENNINRGDASDPFPGTMNKRLFDITTNPSSLDYDSLETFVSVSNISDSDSLMRADLAVVLFRPKLEVVDYIVDDSLGNNDGRADPGEDVGFYVSVKNHWLTADSVYGILSTSSPSIQITIDSVGFPDIPSGDTVWGSPFQFSVLPGSENHIVDFFLHLHSYGGYTEVETLRVMIGRPPVLLVDDDGGKDYERFYESALSSLFFLYDKWSVSKQGGVANLSIYPVVIWFTGDDSVNTLTSSDITKLTDYLDGGGNLFLTGQGIGDDIGGTAFYSDYLKASYTGDIPGKYLVDGVPGDIVGDALKLVITGGDGAGNQVSQDVILPIGGAFTCFTYSGGQSAGVRFNSGTYKVVYLGFGFEGINNLHVLFSDREDVLERVLSWFGLEVGVEENAKCKMQNAKLKVWPNPFRGETVISYKLQVTSDKSNKKLVTNNSSLVTISIYDLTGRLIRTLPLPTAYSLLPTVTWDGRDEDGRDLASGIYFVRLKSGDKSLTAKLVLISSSR